MAQKSYQYHMRIGKRNGEYKNQIMGFDEEADTGHFLRKRGNSGLLECPFNCPALAKITDEHGCFAAVVTQPDQSDCQGMIKNYKKYAFASLSEGGRLNGTPGWLNKIKLCEPGDNIENIIRRVANVSMIRSSLTNTFILCLSIE